MCNFECVICNRNLAAEEEKNKEEKYSFKCISCKSSYYTKHGKVFYVSLEDEIVGQIFCIYEPEGNYWSCRLPNEELICIRRNRSAEAVAIKMLRLREQIYKNKLLEQMLKASTTKDI